MRIALFSWETLHSIPVGGVAAHVSGLSAALCDRGHEVHVFTRQAPGQATYENVGGIHYHRCPYEAHPDFVVDIQRMCDSFVWHFGETEAFLNDGGFNVVHGHDWLCAHALVQAKNTHRKPVVMTVHSTEYGRCGNTHCGGRSEQIAHLEWEGTYVADQVICVSEALREEAREIYQVPAEKMTAVHNGVNAARYNGEVDAACVRAKCGVGQRDPMVLFVGRLAWQKGPDILLAAIPGLLQERPQAKFVFVGDGEMRGDLERDARQMGLGQATRFLGYRNGSALVNLFKSADVVCVPSRNEPFGIVILESWSAGKPVVATRNGGPAEFVSHGYDGLVVRDDSPSVGWGLGTTCSDFEHARWMGRNGRSTVQSRFTWNTIAARTERVYQAAWHR
ncbi:MAG TPA: glycosyltransferase family 4 protein [Phycisphaerae bacterium]|nr:glycosyltransferase family 4 protein [Phycisphaerae bacterium]